MALSDVHCPTCGVPGHTCLPLPLTDPLTQPAARSSDDPAAADDVTGPFPDLAEHAFTHDGGGHA